MSNFYNDNINKEYPWQITALAAVKNSRRMTILITGRGKTGI